MAQTRDELQISFLDLELQQKQSELLPSFEVGQDIFILSLDTVLRGTVACSFLCNVNESDLYYGYSIDLSDGSHTTTWDTDIGKKTFSTAAQAQEHANALSRQLVKINPYELPLHCKVGFEYTRRDDGYILEANIAKVGEDWIYEQKFMCYAFLRRYESSKKRDTVYNALLKDITSEMKRAHGTQTSFKAITLYKTASGIFASREYAKNNGAYIIKPLENVCGDFTQDEELEL